MDDSRNNFLTFSFLDDVMTLLPSERCQHFNKVLPNRISPLVEYIFLNQALEELSQAKASNLDEIRELERILDSENIFSTTNDLTINAKKIEYFRCPQNDQEETSNQWHTFLKRFENAAISAGLNKRFSAAITGTFGEMVGNVREHSQKTQSGIVAYRWNDQEFEYVVSDSGIGVLESLRTNSIYDYILDYEQALETAIKDNESCKGRDTGRGVGFHSLINNIARENSTIRFRSGDKALKIYEHNSEVKNEITTCSYFQGFLISTLCKSKND